MSGTPFTLCADDFGLTEGVSEGVLDLVKKKRLSAVSCIATQPGFKSSAENLIPFANYIDIGIHFVLTDLKALSANVGFLPSRAALFKKVFLGQLPKLQIKTELVTQLKLFEKTFGRQPDFVDGHHHVHQLPGIRDIVLDIIDEYFSFQKPHIRSCEEKFSLILKRGISPIKAIAVSLASVELTRNAMRQSIPLNDGFSGIYDLSNKIPYDKLFERFVIDIRPGALIMCHPGKVDTKLKKLDSLTDQREIELAYFLSDKFVELLKTKNLSLGRLTKVT